MTEVKAGMMLSLKEHRSLGPNSESSDISHSHGQLVLRRWDRLLEIVNTGCSKNNVVVNGESLDIAAVVAVARYKARIVVSEGNYQDMNENVEYMRSILDSGHTIYGVNTGFGGSANVQTDHVEKLQRNLIGFLNCGIVIPPQADSARQENDNLNTGYQGLSSVHRPLPNEDPVGSSTMPEAWARATMLIRSNSLVSGYSGVRPELTTSLAHLLNQCVTPVIPLRGSISASGDLIPLSYIAAVLQGSPEVEVWTYNSGTLGRQRATAAAVLSELSLAPLKLGPKEGLALVNGTAVSAGVGSLALHDAHGIMILSQILTAMGVEALRGSAESFDSIFSEIRPHKGQCEISSNIRKFLRGSKLTTDKAEEFANSDSLRQDRYSIRTAPQWLGPELENLMLADKQLSVEINSTTDNPIIDTRNRKILHGGNFQAMTVTSAMEKTRSAIHSIGRLMFSQATELINPALNNGLPPNLTADEPSLSFLFKGIDISMAALQAELGFLSMPVTPHVQNAEMGNQSLNSLALISSRYTHAALSVISQMSAAYLFTLCQALDLRALHIRFLSALQPDLESVTIELFGPLLTDVDVLYHALWQQFLEACDKTTATDSTRRFTDVIATLRPTILAHVMSQSQHSSSIMLALEAWTERSSVLALRCFQSTRSNYSGKSGASEYLGSASKRMYEFVRDQLGIPFLISPTEEVFAESSDVMGGASLGGLLTKIYCAIQDGTLYGPVMDCLRDVQAVN